MLLKDIITKGIETVSQTYPEREAREMVFMLLEHMLGTRRHTHIVEPEYRVDELKVGEVDAAFLRLAAGEPLQYVCRQASFYGRDFHVSPAVLIPRPETELVCRTALESVSRGQRLETSTSAPKILDLCTGSGCIAWTMALECPGSEVTAVDISEDALAIASTQNFSEEIQRTGAKTPIFLRADVLGKTDVLVDILSGQDGLAVAERRTYDLILSNPPYVMDKEKSLMRGNVLDHEPHLALFVSDDDPLIFYDALARLSAELLAPSGTGIVEINEALGQETAEVFIKAGFPHAEVLKDLSERDRFVLFRW